MYGPSMLDEGVDPLVWYSLGVPPDSGERDRDRDRDRERQIERVCEKD